ncbi:hypothetical protein D3C73_1617190 [compost metagenome]
MLRHNQNAAAGMETNVFTGKTESIKQHPGCRQGSVTAQIDFDSRGKPAKMVAVFYRYKKGGL